MKRQPFVWRFKSSRIRAELCLPAGLLSVVIIPLQIDIDLSTAQTPAAAPGSVGTAAASLKIRST